MPDNRGRGRPSRGARKGVVARVPEDHYAVYNAEAAQLGIPIGSWATMQLAKLYNLPVPQYVLEEIEDAAYRRAAEAAQASRDQLAGLDALEGSRPLARSA